jgi:hypothetical protein
MQLRPKKYFCDWVSLCISAVTMGSAGPMPQKEDKSYVEQSQT